MKQNNDDSWIYHASVYDDAMACDGQVCISKSDDSSMNLFTACSRIEGFGNEPASEKEQLEAWAFILKTKAYLHLQGCYGCFLADLIANGYLSQEGEILVEL